MALSEGELYDLLLQVTNNSFQQGVPSGAHLTIVVDARTPTATIIDNLTQDAVFEPREGKGFSFPLDIPLGTDGEILTIIGEVLAPSGLMIAQDTQQYSIGLEIPVLSLTYAGLNYMDILGVNGISFSSVGIDIATLASPIIAPSMPLITLNVNIKSQEWPYPGPGPLAIFPEAADLTYEPCWAATEDCLETPIYYSPMMKVSGLQDVALSIRYKPGFYCEGLYNGEFRIYWDPTGYGAAVINEFTILNMLQCEGEGEAPAYF